MTAPKHVIVRQSVVAGIFNEAVIKDETMDSVTLWSIALLHIYPGKHAHKMHHTLGWAERLKRT